MTVPEAFSTGVAHKIGRFPTRSGCRLDTSRS
jgi:hypothetical protein